MPELRLIVRSASAQLDRPITGVYSTELPDPSRYLTAGQLVVSGLLWWRGPEDAEVFVRALAAHDVAALAASGTDTGGVLPDALVRACDRHGVTVLEVPLDLSFAVITEQVVLGLAASRTGVNGPQQRLLTAAARCHGLAELLAVGEQELGGSCWVLTASGRIAGGTAEPAGIDMIRAELRHADPGSLVLGGHALVPIPNGVHAVLPWYLVVEIGVLGPRGENRPVVDQFAALIGLERVRAEHQRQVEARAAQPLIRLLASGSATTVELSAQLAAAGLPTSAQFRVIAAATPPDPDRSAAILDELLTESELAGPVGAVDDGALALVDANSPTPTRDTAARLHDHIGSGRVLIGISAPTGILGLLGAAQEARQAVALGELRTGPIQLVNGVEIPPHQLALAGLPSELRAGLRRRVLGPVLDYDAANNTDLVGTLREFLDCSGSWTVAAERLHVHVNTLRYRIGRIAQLTGADLDSFATRVDLFLALAAETREG